MSVICFASLKGGVGKTSLSINVGHAFVHRGCKTLLIDIDPTAHASRYFSVSKQKIPSTPLARTFLSQDILRLEHDGEEIIGSALEGETKIINNIRNNYDIIEGGAELRYFYWGRGARTFRALFPALIEELKNSYDHILIDTAPDFNVLLRNAVAASELIVVPVDASAMSIDCLEELVTSCSHITRPCWSIVRTMVNKSAIRVQQMSKTRLEQKLHFTSTTHYEDDRSDGVTSARLIGKYNGEDTSDFISMLHEREGIAPSAKAGSKPENKESPIYLLNSFINRTEQQNRLSFLNKTAFDGSDTGVLASQYLQLAKEVEELISVVSESELLSDNSEAMVTPWGEDGFTQMR